MKQFTIRDALMLVTATAAGFWLARFGQLGLAGFFLGALTALISGGLVGQIVSSPTIATGGIVPGYGRQCVLGMILITLGVAIYQTLHPFVPSAAEAKIYEIEPDKPIESTFGLPLWWFCLFLGSLTSPGISPTPPEHQTKRRRISRRIISAAVVMGLFVYVIALTRSWALITALVDIAINGMKNGLFQGLSVGTDEYVEWFGRTPAEFQDFCRIQFPTWIALLTSFFLAIGFANQSPKPSRSAEIFRLMLVVGLALPAVWNIAWLASGNASRLFPEFISTFWQQPRHDLWLAPFLAMVLAVYFSTRRVDEENPQRSESQPRRYWSDSGFVSLLFLTPVFFHSGELIESVEWMLVWYEDDAGIWETAKLYFYVYADLIVGSPEYCWTIFLSFHAVFLGWRWWKRPSNNFVRWPHVGARQATWMPIIFVLLGLLIALAIPCGVAIQHTLI